MRSVLAAVLALGVLGLLGVTNAAAQAPTQDSVVLTGGPAFAGPFVDLQVSATSGPSGENASGQVSFTTTVGPVTVGGPVTCLAVSGKTALLNFQDQVFGLGIITIEAVDGQPDTFNGAPLNRAPTDCSPLPAGFSQNPVSGGDITVTDAQPSPSSKGQCKHGGWRTFGVFKNQGECVRSVPRQAHTTRTND